MAFQEIVAAVIDSGTITADMAQIEAARLLGKHVRYVTREGARVLASRDRSTRWSQLAAGPTLFLSQNSHLFRFQT